MCTNKPRSSRAVFRRAAARFDVPSSAPSSTPSPTKTTAGKGLPRCRRASRHDKGGSSFPLRLLLRFRWGAPPSSSQYAAGVDEEAAIDDGGADNKGPRWSTTEETKNRRRVASLISLIATPLLIARPTADPAPQ